MSNEMENSNINDLSSESRDKIVTAGIELISALSEVLGADAGIAAWEKMSESVGYGLREAVFLAMLSGETGKSVRIEAVNYNNFVSTIKVTRTVLGLGLKEAKDIVDQVRGGKPFTFKVPPEYSKSEIVRAFKEVGATLS